MTITTVLPGVPGNRAIEMLTGSDAILRPVSTATTQLADIGGLLSTIEDGASDVTGSASPIGNGTVAELAEPLILAANDAVLDLHYTLENTGHQIPVTNYPLHALTDLGETVGLGRVGTDANLVSDVLNAPDHVLGGDATGAVQPLPQHLVDIVSGGETLADTLTGVGASNGGLIGPNGVLSPVLEVADTAVGTLHGALENAGHDIPILNGPIHAVTNLGETIGLGHLSDAGGNLLVDTISAPGNILAGGDIGHALQPVLTDVGDVLDGVGGLVNSLEGSGNGLSLGGLTGGLAGPDGALSPVLGVADGIVGTVHTTLEGIGHDNPILNEPIHAVTNLGETVGLGHLTDASGNLLVDAVATPGTILAGGNVGDALQPVANDLGDVLDAAGGLVNSVGGADGGGLIGDAIGTVGGGQDGGPLGPLGPVGDLTGGFLGQGGNGGSPLIDIGVATIDIPIGTAPQGQGPLLEVHLLDAGTIAIPSLGGAGADSLAGGLLDTAPQHGAVADTEPAIPDLGLPELADLGSVLSTGPDHHGQQSGPMHSLI